MIIKTSWHSSTRYGFCTNYVYLLLYNNPSYSRILIGSRLWSFRGQMHDWRHHYKVFHSAVLKWRKVLRIMIIFYVTGHKIRYKKVLPRHWTGSRNKKTKDKAVSFRKWYRNNFLAASVGSRARLKPRTNLVTIALSRTDLANPINKMFLRLMYLKKFNFPHYQNNCWHADWCQEWNIKTSLLKIS